MLITRNILQDSVIENTASRSSRASEGSRHAHFRDTPRGRVSVCARAPVWRTSPTSCLWPAQLRRRNSSFLFRASRCPRRVLILTVVAYTFSLLIQRNGQSFHSNDFQVKAWNDRKINFKYGGWNILSLWLLTVPKIRCSANFLKLFL